MGSNDRILVWDAPTRTFHWLLVFSFAVAFATGDFERLQNAHVILGYTVGGLLGLRLVWAVAGTRYARLSSFLFGPRSLAGYLRSLLRGAPVHFVGHNPAGSWAIYALVSLGGLVVLSGWGAYAGPRREWLEDLHEGLANAMLAVVLVHVAGALLSSLLHRENLVRAMVTGRKRGPPEAAIRSPRRLVAVVLALAVVSFWWLTLVDTARVPQLPAALLTGGHEANDEDDD